MKKHSPVTNVCLVWAHKNPMKRYPAFKTLWKERREKMLEDYEDAFKTAAAPYEDDIGSIFVILADGKPIGVTGYCYYEEQNRVGLVWHGILPEYRGKGYAAEALRRVMKLASYRFPDVKTFVELVPLDREAELAPFFKKNGFVKTGTEYQVEWLDPSTRWFEWAKNL